MRKELNAGKLESAERNMKIQKREMLAECGRRKWGLELRWKGWPCQLFYCDERHRKGWVLGRYVYILRGRVREQRGRDERIKIVLGLRQRQ